MKGRLIVAGALAAAVLPALPAAARAQGPECSGQNTVVQDACQKAVDMFQFLAPQLGTSIAGGAAIQAAAARWVVWATSRSASAQTRSAARCRR
jgi:hypothetical protein